MTAACNFVVTRLTDGCCCIKVNSGTDCVCERSCGHAVVAAGAAFEILILTSPPFCASHPPAAECCCISLSVRLLLLSPGSSPHYVHEQFGPLDAETRVIRAKTKETVH